LKSLELSGYGDEGPRPWQPVLKLVVKQKGAAMESVLAWLAAATRANEANKGAKLTHHSAAFADPRAPTDNFLVGVAAVALRFSRPIADNPR